MGGDHLSQFWLFKIKTDGTGWFIGFIDKRLREVSDIVK
jgi:hypothetical protein